MLFLFCLFTFHDPLRHIIIGLFQVVEYGPEKFLDGVIQQRPYQRERPPRHPHQDCALVIACFWNGRFPQSLFVRIPVLVRVVQALYSAFSCSLEERTTISLCSKQCQRTDTTSRRRVWRPDSVRHSATRSLPGLLSQRRTGVPRMHRS